MSNNLASDLGNTSPLRGGGAKKRLIVVKLLVTVACFGYLSRHVGLSEVLSTIPLLDFRWVVFATLVVVLQSVAERRGRWRARLAAGSARL
jgi:hypothetical protein